MKIELMFPPVSSIKDKRKIVNSVKMKVLSHFKIPVSEVDDQELYNSSVLGLAFVTIKNDHCISKSQKIVTFLEEHCSDVFYDHDILIEEH